MATVPWTIGFHGGRHECTCWFCESKLLTDEIHAALTAKCAAVAPQNGTPWAGGRCRKLRGHAGRHETTYAVTRTEVAQFDDWTLVAPATPAPLEFPRYASETTCSAPGWTHCWRRRSWRGREGFRCEHCKGWMKELHGGVGAGPFGAGRFGYYSPGPLLAVLDNESNVAVIGTTEEGT